MDVTELYRLEIKLILNYFHEALCKNSVLNMQIQGYSMEPTLRNGSMISIRKKDRYCIGDIVLYVSDEGKLIIHRIVNVKGGTYSLKGDNNNFIDNPILEDRIIGCVDK